MIGLIDRDRQTTLVLSDLLGFLLAMSVVLTLQPSGLRWSWPSFLLVSVLAIMWAISLKLAGSYEYLIGRWSEPLALVKGSLLFTGLLIALGLLQAKPFAHIATLIATCAIASFFFRKTVAPVLLRFAGHTEPIRVLIIGEGIGGKRLGDLLRRQKLYQLYCMRTEPKPAATSGEDPFNAVLDEYQPQQVVLALNGSTGKRLEPMVRLCDERRIAWKVVPSLGHYDTDDLCSQVLGGLPLIGVKSSVFAGMNLRIKQALDLVLASAVLVVCAPLMAAIWTLIRLDSPGSALISQPRIGYKGKVFNLYKFRTMFADSDDSTHRAYIKEWYAGKSYSGSDSQSFKIVADRRVTRVGRFLRRYSLDELPQIFNVFKLEMSLVGPRPSLVYEFEFYQDWHKERLDAPPGVTGLWQVAGRNRTTFNEMAKLDIEYVRNWSPARDFSILLRTIPAVIKGTGY